MTKPNRHYLFAGSMLGLMLGYGPAHAADDTSFMDRFDVDTRLTLQYIGDDNTDLGTADENSNHSFSQQLQLRVGAELADNYSLFFHGRGLNILGDSGFDDDNGNGQSSVGSDSFLELRELYVTRERLLGYTPASLQVGRMRIQEPRALWWNSDNDLVRLNYNTTLLNAFIAAGEDLGSYRNNTDSDYRRDDRDRFRILGETSWQYRRNHFLETRFVNENDHSGTLANGTVFNNGDRDLEDQNLTWVGLRATGRSAVPSTALSNLVYRLDLIGLAGEQTMQTSAVLANGQRAITGANDQSVLAWALDSGLTVDPLGPGGTLLTFNYAFGSGDDGSGTSHEFRQTDLQGSSSRVGLERQQQRNYGEVLRPELSNIHILAAGLAQPISDATDIGATYYYYRLAEDATSLRSSGIKAGLNGTDKDIGSGVDVFMNIDMDEEFNFNTAYTSDIDLRLVAGAFMPGDAYGDNNGDNVHRISAELKFRF